MASCSNLPANKSKLQESTTTIPNWLELPKDITSNILQRLGAVEILTNARNVCPYWWNICKDPLMWRTIQMTDIRMLRQKTSTLSKICRYAVDRSCGRLEDIFIKYFATDELVKYIADRASNLKCLRIEEGLKSMSKEGLYEALKKLPLLEELDISKCRLLHVVSFEVIGLCCPLLKSLNLNGFFDKLRACDDQVLGIAKTMPGLRDLKIMKNKLTNVGLIAILDGCPLLESLDLRGCFHLDLSGSLGKRCNEQIKEVRLPTDVIDESDDTCDDPDLLITLKVRWLGSVILDRYDFLNEGDVFDEDDFSHLDFEEEDFYEDDFY